MQNGLDHQKRVAPFLPAGTEVLPVLVDVVAERVSPGRVVHHHGHRLFVPATSPAAARFAGLWHGSPVQVVQESEFVTAAWRKLLINIVANPLTALLQERIGVFREPEMSRLAEDILREAAAVARAEDAHITEDDIHGTVKRFMTVPADGGTSMLYDRLARRPMEHEFISGPIVHAGEHHDIPTPLNRMLLTLMRTVDRRHAEPAHDSTPAGAACRGENVCRR
jgi:2-dehydropantoate 2-reductase